MKEKEIDLNNKFILDACCSVKGMWYNKNHPNAVYMDIRKENKGFLKHEKNSEINPDIIGDFRNLPKQLKNHKFKLIVFDPPHFKGKSLTGDLTKKFGALQPETWQYDLKKAFNELWGVLDDHGILLFKFSNYHIKFEEVLNILPEKPLVQNIMNGLGRSETKWFCFMKIPGKVVVK